MELTKKDSNIIKGMAVLMLLYSHLFLSKTNWPFFQSIELFNRPMATYLTIFTNPVICVFLFISGYGLYRKFETLQEGGHAQLLYIWRKLKTIYFQFWIIFFLAIVLLIIFNFNFYAQVHYSLGSFIADFFGVSYLLDTTTINSSYWYITVILFSYLLSPVLFLISKKAPIPAICGSSLVIIVFCIFLKEGKAAGGFGDMIIRLVPFEFGMLFARENWFSKITHNKIILYGGPCLVGAITLIVKYYFDIAYALDTIIAICEIVLALQFFRFLYNKGKKHYFLRYLEFLGKQSLIIYLIHAYFVLYLKSFVFALKIPVLVFTMFLVINSILSVGFAKLFKYLHIIE